LSVAILAGVDVEAGDAEASFCEEQRERQTDVAEADDGDAGLTRFDTRDPL